MMIHIDDGTQSITERTVCHPIFGVDDSRDTAVGLQTLDSAPKRHWIPRQRDTGFCAKETLDSAPKRHRIPRQKDTWIPRQRETNQPTNRMTTNQLVCDDKHHQTNSNHSDDQRNRQPMTDCKTTELVAYPQTLHCQSCTNCVND